MTVLREGSIEFLALVEPEALEVRFRDDPAGVVRELLSERRAPMDERAIRDRLVGKLHLDTKVVSARLPRALTALQSDPHIRFSPEYEKPCFEWSDEPLPPSPHALLQHRPWRHLVNELTSLKLTEDEQEVLRARVAADPPEPFVLRLGLAAVGATEWPEADEVALRTGRAGLGSELASLPESMLRVLRRQTREAGRGDLQWMLVLTARKSLALRGIGSELGEDAVSVAGAHFVLGVFRTELRSSPRGKVADWWADVVARLPRLTDLRLVAGVLAVAQVTPDANLRRALVEAMDAAALLALSEAEFATAVEEVDVPRATAICREVGLTELGERFAGLLPDARVPEASSAS